MAFEIALALAIFVVTTSITPGPNNAMVFASGVSFGFRRTLPHLFGIGFGFFVLVYAAGFGLSAVVKSVPWLFTLIKIVGGLYLCWIAWKIATTRSLGNGNTSDGRPMTFIEAALFQWANPKSWVMAVSATATYVDPQHYDLTLAIVALMFLLLGFPCTIVWAAAGTSLRGWLSHPAKLKYFNITMGILLVLSLWPVIRL